MSKTVRLDKFLADAGEGTRSQVKKLIRNGAVQINGVNVRNPEQKISPDEDQVCVSGRMIQSPEEFVYYLLNKPAGCITATEDEKEKTVMDHIPGGRRDLFPVGRLDKDTEGLLLITNDGQTAHRLLSPKKHVEKTYFVRVEGLAAPDDIRAVESGMDIGDEKPTLPGRMKIERLYPEKGESEILLTICEGRFHQIKRMMQALGKPVLYLKRISMGPLALPDDLEKGECRKLTEEEIQCLKSL